MCRGVGSSVSTDFGHRMEGEWLLLYAAVIIISFASYSPSIFGEFIFDDYEAILTNDDIDPSHSSWTDVFQHDFWGNPITSNTSHKSYRPLTVLSFRLDFLIGKGRNPLVFHLTNVVLHSIASVLFTMVARELQYGFRMDNMKLFPCTAGLMFATHPVHTECVAGIVGRAEVWSAIFYFLAFLLHQKFHPLASTSMFVSVTLSAVVVFLAGAGMFFKEQGITTLGLCIVYELIKGELNDKIKLIRVVLIGMGGAGLVYMRLSVMNFQSPTFQRMDNPAIFENNSFTWIMSLNYIYALNAWILVNPYWLCFDWSIGCVPLIHTITDSRVPIVVLFWSVLAIVGGRVLVTVLTTTIIKSRRLISMCVAMIVIPFLPSSNLFFKVGFVLAERVLYLPSAGYCLTVALGFSCLRKLNKQLAHGFVSFIMLMFIGRSLVRSIDWISEERLFTSGLSVCSLNAKVHYNVGKLMADKGENREAEEYYREAIRLYPEYDQALNNLGNLLKNENPLEGEILLQKAVTLNPTFAAAWMNLGTIKMALRKYKEAEQCYLNAIRSRKGYSDAFYNLGLTYIETERFTEAADALKTAINYKQDHIEAWNNLGLLYLNTNDLESGEAFLRVAVSRFPHLPQFHSTFGVILGRRGKYEEASKELLSAIQMEPNNSKYYANLGVIYHLSGEYKRAQELYEKALEMDSSLSDTAMNLVKLKNKLKRNS